MRRTRDPRALSAGLSISRIAFATAFALIAASADASFGGPLHIGFGGMFVAAACFALPGAALVALAEWIGAVRPPWRWIGVLAGAAALYCAKVAIGIGERADAVFFWLPVPPLATLALVALVRNARERRIATWLVAGAAFAFGVYRALAIPRRDPDELVGALVGGAFVSMLSWQLAHSLRQRGRATGPIAHATAGPVPPEQPAAIAALATDLRTGEVAARADFGRRVRILPAGARWFLGGALVFYVVVGMMIAAGFDALFEAMRTLEWQVADLFGWRTRSLEGRPLAVWAAHGVVWSAIAGFGTWSAAALGGRFEPGALQPLRFAGLVCCFAMFVAILVVTGKLRLY